MLHLHRILASPLVPKPVASYVTRFMLSMSEVDGGGGERGEGGGGGGVAREEARAEEEEEQGQGGGRGKGRRRVVAEAWKRSKAWQQAWPQSLIDFLRGAREIPSPTRSGFSRSKAPLPMPWPTRGEP